MIYKEIRYETASVKSVNRMERAIDLAYASDMRQKHGAILYVGGRVISVGVNTYRNPPLKHIPHDAVSTHAEIAALSGVQKRATNNGILYIARISPGGFVSTSEPCDACKSYLERYTNVRMVVYSGDLNARDRLGEYTN